MIKISKIFGDFVPRDSSLCQGLLPSIRHFENRRGEGPGDEVVRDTELNMECLHGDRVENVCPLGSDIADEQRNHVKVEHTLCSQSR